MFKKTIIYFLTVLISLPLSAQLYVSGVLGVPYEYRENLVGTDLEAVFVLNTLSNAEISYNSSANDDVKFYYYTNSIADKQEITDIIASPSLGSVNSKIKGLQDGRGYVVEKNGKLEDGVWIVDYAQHKPVLNSIEALEPKSCEDVNATKLLVDKSDRIYFYAQTGGRREIKRTYTIRYNTLEWNETEERFDSKVTEIRNQDIGSEIIVEAPLKETQFEIEGDQFGYHFELLSSIKSGIHRPARVNPHIVAEQEDRQSENEQGHDGKLGGSAPVKIQFFGYSNEPVTRHYTWFIYNKKDKENHIARFVDKDIKYDFFESGDYEVKLEVADENSICPDTISVEFKVTESFLDIPNYFNPGAPTGINAEFRVAYKSLIRFKCTIFNRWGNKLYQWTNPAEGWDGKYKGTYVKPGVYFYVIDAMGSDGIHYKRGGDINILRSN